MRQPGETVLHKGGMANHHPCDHPHSPVCRLPNRRSFRPSR